MFSDKFGLTQAFLGGRKTMTRRIIDAPSNTLYMKPVLDLCGNIIKVYALDPDGRERGVFVPRYKVGEVVAVAQAYKYVESELNTSGVKRVYNQSLDLYEHPLTGTPGWDNKMFVKAELMPHRILITNVRVERLQDISDEDCLREGIVEHCPGVQYGFSSNFGYCGQYPFSTPRGAFSALIDKVSGRGTWGNNPWNFAYEFELVK